MLFSLLYNSLCASYSLTLLFGSLKLRLAHFQPPSHLEGELTMNRLLVVLLLVSLLSINASAYGPRGHQLVGAIADRRLKKKPAIAGKVRDLLDGLTLQRAATLPDEIKGWHCGDEPS